MSGPTAYAVGDAFLLSVTRVRARTAWRGVVVGRAFTFIARDLNTAPGLVAASLRREDLRTFWTLTLWQGLGDMAGFRNQNPHRSWMGSVEALCDESSWHRRTWPQARLPEWPEAERLLREQPHFTAMDGVSDDQASGLIASRRLGRVWTVGPARGGTGTA